MIDFKKLKPELPAEGIMGTGDFGDSKFYRISCTCGDDAHSINMCIEADELTVTVHHWATVKTDWWRETFKITYDENFVVLYLKGFANTVINRVSLAKRALFTGYIEFDGETSLTAQQALNYAETLKNAVAEIDTLRKSSSAKRKEKSNVV